MWTLLPRQERGRFAPTRAPLLPRQNPLKRGQIVPAQNGQKNNSGLVLLAASYRCGLSLSEYSVSSLHRDTAQPSF